MKKILFIVAIALTLFLTGCFAKADAAKADLASVGNTAKGTQQLNEDGISAVKSEISITDKNKYKDLTKPNWGIQ